MKKIGVGTFRASKEMRKNVNDVLDTGRLSYGPYSMQFEREFSDLHDCGFGILSNSGTSALHVALQALKEVHGWQDGDEVIVPAITFVATVNIVLHNNLTPVLVDVDPRTYNIDPSKINITDKTRAIIPVHLFGQPADMTRIQYLVKDTDIKIIEDSCECMFANHGNQVVGSMGDIGCFSTYVAHILTMGVGGICTTNNSEYAEVIRSLVNHGRDAIYKSIDTEGTREVMEKRFEFPRVGHSFRITELESAIGVAQLDDMPRQIDKRKRIASRITDVLSHFPDLQLPYTQPGNDNVFMMYPIILKHGNKWDLCSHLESRGIETREMMPLTNQPAYDFSEVDYPMAMMVNRKGFYIGSHHNMSGADVYTIFDAFQEYFDER
jgi:dTDP-4-amino-4,6-dideoxygalactose transaminase